MRFCRWYPLAEAGAHAPAAPGILQVRVAEGLLAYPRGKSAMIWYGYVEDVRAMAVATAAQAPAEAVWWGRHAEELTASEAGRLPAIALDLRDQFVRRFGEAPRLP